MLGTVYERKQENEKAFKFYNEALKIGLKLYTKDNEILGSIHMAIGRVGLILNI